MAKIFSLQFEFLNQRYTALVSTGNDAVQPSIHIQFATALPVGLFPVEHIRYKGFGGYKQLHGYSNPAVKKLLKNLAFEIECELSNRWAIVRKLATSFE